MDVRINIDKRFEKDLKPLTLKDNEAIKKRVNLLIDIIRTGQNPSRYLNALHRVRLSDNLEGSLYTFKVTQNLRIILTSEQDPLFGEHILTLLRVVRHSEQEKSFKSMEESLYQSFLNRNTRDNG